MLDTCFLQPANLRRRVPRASLLASPSKGGRFEDRAFNALLEHASSLGISEIWRCHAARTDGYLRTMSGETILLEMKECLGWGAMQAAATELLMGKQLLGLDATRGLIVFERLSAEWEKIQPYGAWGQLALHAQELAGHLDIGGLRVMADGSLQGSPHTNPPDSRSPACCTQT